MTNFEALPTDPNKLAAWLERQLVGIELAWWVVRLEALRRELTGAEHADELTLDQIFSSTELTCVLENGLSTMDEAVPRLFAHPNILFELQERIFVDGGAYWDHVERDDQHRQLIHESAERRRAAASLQHESASDLGGNQSSALAFPARDSKSPPKSMKHSSMVSWVIATAASLLIVTVVGRYFSPTNSVGPDFVMEIEDRALYHPDLRDKKFVDALNTALTPQWKESVNPKEFNNLLGRYYRACIKLGDAVADPKATHLSDPKDVRRIATLLRKCADEIAEAQARLQAGKPLNEIKLAANNSIDNAQIELTNLAATIAARGEQTF